MVFGSQAQGQEQMDETRTFRDIKQERSAYKEQEHVLYPDQDLLPLVPLQLTRQETDDSSKLYNTSKLVISSRRGNDGSSERSSRHNGRKKQKEDSDSDATSDHTSCISKKSEKNTKAAPTLYSLLHEMVLEIIKKKLI